MIRFSEYAEQLSFAMATSLLASDYPTAIKAAYAFREDRQQAEIAHQKWADKLLADNLAECVEDRYRREKYGIKEDE